MLTKNSNTTEVVTRVVGVGVGVPVGLGVGIGVAAADAAVAVVEVVATRMCDNNSSDKINQYRHDKSKHEQYSGRLINSKTPAISKGSDNSNRSEEKRE